MSLRNLACALLLSGCATVSLTPYGEKVRTMRGDPPMSCEEIGPVVGRAQGVTSIDGGVHQETIEEAYVILRNTAGEKGANFVRIQDEGEVADHGGNNFIAYRVMGVAFRCKN